MLPRQRCECIHYDSMTTCPSPDCDRRPASLIGDEVVHSMRADQLKCDYVV